MAAPQFSPAVEALRQAAIDDLQIDPLLRGSLEMLTSQAARAFDVPMAAITLLGRDRQIFEAKVGINVAETPREHALCNWTIQSPTEVTIIEDALVDPRSASNPFVQGAPGLRFYAAAPLTLNGVTIGSLCVLDTEPHHPPPDKLHALRRLGDDVLMNLRARFFRRARSVMGKADTIRAARGRVLAVDDSDVMLLLLVSQLELAGFRVVGVESGEKALAAVKAEDFDAVVLDVQMAEMTGLDVARALRSDPRTRSWPIALYSGHDEAAVSAHSADYDVYLEKPIDVEALSLTIDRLIRKD